ncbi:MAG: hypothetical protein ACMUEL_04250 [Flavobacteriales bacterium Tduv]
MVWIRQGSLQRISSCACPASLWRGYAIIRIVPLVLLWLFIKINIIN